MQFFTILTMMLPIGVVCFRGILYPSSFLTKATQSPTVVLKLLQHGSKPDEDLSEEAQYFDERENQSKDDTTKKILEKWITGWEGFSEEPPYMDEAEVHGPDHEYYERTSNSLSITENSLQCEVTLKPILEKIFINEIPQNEDETDGLIKGWEGFSEDPPYYDDDYLIDENYGEETFYTANPRHVKGSNVDIDVAGNSYVIRDKSGVQLGWSDWNEDEPSYFDEAYASDDESFGDNLTKKLRDVAPPADLIEYASSKLKTDAKETIICSTESLNQGDAYVEWEDWDSTGAILGLDRWEQDWDNSGSLLVRERDIRGENFSKKSSVRTHSAKGEEETVIPYEGLNQKEWDDWDNNEAYLGLDTDFGDD